MLNRIAPAWRAAFPLTVLTVLAVCAVYFDTMRSMVLIWRDHETYTHGFLIAPISVWLIWQRRKQLAAVSPQPAWNGLLLFFGLAFLWLLGELAGVQVVQHYALVAMIVAVVYTLIGWPATRVILAPLGFLLLAVPFGEAFIDPLINWTADFTVAALQMTGIPVFREGNTFSLPSGNWSVVAACSGVRYLIASVTLGFVYAYLTYRSLWRRALFILASILVPILANGLRAYMIVMIGHLSDMKYAVGVDHLIYGWLFFGVVMLLLFWVGSFWREDEEPEPVLAESVPATGASPRGILPTAIGMVILALVAPIYSGISARAAEARPPVVLTAPSVPGWAPSEAGFTTWQPEFSKPSATITRFHGHGGEQAGLYIAYYRNQHQGAELIHSENVLAKPGGEAWRRLQDNARPIALGDRTIPARASLITNNGNGQRLMAYYAYWVGGHFTTNIYAAKARQALERLLLRGDDGAVVVFFAPMSEDENRAVLDDFAIAALPGVRQILVAARAQ